jgi:hypothetical protein
MASRFHRFILYVVCFFVWGVLAISPIAVAAQELSAGMKAPIFSAESANKKQFDLAKQAGKLVVLEWSNHLCPFVQKHYKSGNMQKLQQFAHRNGLVWVTILSSAPGKQGHVTPGEALRIAKENSASPDYIIRDEDGSIGRMYKAKTTPHMFLIGSDGTLLYNGAIDSIHSIDQEDVARAETYFYHAMKAAKEGGKIEISQTKPYGCSVKY